MGIITPQFASDNLFITQTNGSCQIKFLVAGNTNSISVHSLTGQLIASCMSTKLELPPLPSGVYFVKAIQDSVLISRKFVIAD
ncbi:MAG: T9SS type A sorting domain-containing protein [Flavobacteriaceae bacterium]|nr:T9SS type A sorting domain-containing protein [Flavobacteriaceae bacterium]